LADRTRHKAEADDQLSLDEKTVEDDEIEEALEQREKLKEHKNNATKDYRTAHDRVVGLIDQLGVSEDQAVRVGRFRLSRSHVAGRNVAFETLPTDRLVISCEDDQ